MAIFPDKDKDKDPYDQEILSAYKHLVRPLRRLSKADRRTIRKAFEMAWKAHETQKRKSGEPYILHPLEVARILVVEMGLEDTTGVICALLHDVVEDTEIELADIKREFGNKAMNIIDGLTKISASPELDGEMVSQQAETFRKILLTISNDVRVVLIKLADRLHNMRTMGAMREESMRKITSETLYIYAPLAHRLGLYESKTELEDLSFKFSNPTLYKEISEKVEAKKERSQKYIDIFIQEIKQRLKENGLKFIVKSRFKSIYSIYTKMQRKKLPFEEIYDIYAVRIILTSKPDQERENCWRAYSVISNLYRPNPKRLRDWITVPKENGYESLHTTLMGDEGKWVEVQIRTERMDDIAEKGIAAHWKYKDNGEVQDELLTEWIGRIREILQNPDLNALEAVTEFQANLVPQDVFVYTPRGELVRLPFNSTVLDFAYKIHTNIGDTAIGAKVNTQVVPLNTKVRPGDQVEIINTNKVQVKEEWLRFVHTPRAKDSIRTTLRKEKKKIVNKGKAAFHWKARTYGVDEHHPYFQELLTYFMLPDAETFFYRLGSHNIDTEEIQRFIDLKREGKEIKPKESLPNSNGHALESMGVDPDMLVVGEKMNIDNTVLSSCCNPIPGDEILGYDDGRHIQIHRATCKNAIQLMSSFGSRIIKANWHSHATDSVEFLVAIQVRGLDKKGVLIEIIRIISQRMKLNMRGVTIESEGGMFEGLFKVFVCSSQEMNKLIDNLAKLDHIYTVGRVDTHQDYTVQPLKN